ncbi:MAG: undecaprenyl/decaprenyl-phosphate alpha-N-acetylglucosaminyl 1-phosphate transferase [Ruminococcaceae bacterium]|nr:undecaprenyl/decaprenyl-phosphate alpha-N-acetylglucosaminyl 1-phosphate transferase [Oscillospiraceae bacterium]
MENLINTIIYAVSAVLCSGLLAFALTPPVRVLAFLIGAVDVPTDERRMHTKPTPRIGGLAIFGGFAISALVFGTYTPALGAVLAGGFIMVVMGILDDVYRLKAWVKLIVQVAAAVVAVLFGVVIEHITLFGYVIEFGVLSIPISILWIVGLTNAINLLDGLDGLACGVSAIMSITLLGVVLLHGDYQSALIMAILAAACLGFLPFNMNPARIFMGDTGSLFLGYTMAVMSVQGVFKMHTVISFIIPIAMFALPLLDTLFAIFRRIKGGESPFAPDRKHLHHKLVDMGFTQREAVRILYAVCGILGLVSITFSEDIFSEYKLTKTLIVAACAIIVFGLNYIVMKKTSSRVLSGLAEHGYTPIKKGEELSHETDKK